MDSGLQPTPSDALCECGHPFAPNHQTPGAECFVYGCDCSTFKSKASLFSACARVKGLCDEVAALQAADVVDGATRWETVRDQLVLAALYEIPQVLEASDVYSIRRKIGQWLRLRGDHAAETTGLADYLVPKDKQASVFQQLAADADHSDLLVRLLIGEAPLPFDEWRATHEVR